ncbi:MAG TPA: hypothetical protein IGR64_01645 [Leptolyngbyaceae cyanobacterium M65_K2018_010]|nr:hypothetical protein [Leptolyngbyaceae cyanobacterium M65_K2018_010]
MKFGYRHALGLAQRGALGGTAGEHGPEIAELAQHADHLEERLRHLKSGINNLIQLHQLQGSSVSPQDQHRIQAELNQLETWVEDFETELASRLFSWQHLQEPFWQAVRYGGLGLVGGWFLHWLVQRG